MRFASSFEALNNSASDWEFDFIYTWEWATARTNAQPTAATISGVQTTFRRFHPGLDAVRFGIPFALPGAKPLEENRVQKLWAAPDGYFGNGGVKDQLNAVVSDICPIIEGTDPGCAGRTISLWTERLGVADYENSVNCVIPLRSASPSFKLVFTTLEVERDWDHVRLYDGPSVHSPMIATVSGKSSQGPYRIVENDLHPSYRPKDPFVSSTDHVLLEWHADGDTGGVGFTICQEGLPDPYRDVAVSQPALGVSNGLPLDNSTLVTIDIIDGGRVVFGGSAEYVGWVRGSPSLEEVHAKDEQESSPTGALLGSLNFALGGWLELGDEVVQVVSFGSWTLDAMARTSSAHIRALTGQQSILFFGFIEEGAATSVDGWSGMLQSLEDLEDGWHQLTVSADRGGKDIQLSHCPVSVYPGTQILCADSAMGPEDQLSGAVVRSSLTEAGQAVVYSFDATEGAAYTITVTSTDSSGGTSHPYLSLYDSSHSSIDVEEFPAFVVVAGPCIVTEAGQCVGQPDGYGARDTCEISVTAPSTLGPSPIFDTETGYDILAIDGAEFSGDSDDVLASLEGVPLTPQSTISFEADRDTQGDGWEICVAHDSVRSKHGSPAVSRTMWIASATGRFFVAVRGHTPHATGGFALSVHTADVELRRYYIDGSLVGVSTLTSIACNGLPCPLEVESIGNRALSSDGNGWPMPLSALRFLDGVHLPLQVSSTEDASDSEAVRIRQGPSSIEMTWMHLHAENETEEVTVEISSSEAPLEVSSTYILSCGGGPTVCSSSWMQHVLWSTAARGLSDGYPAGFNHDIDGTNATERVLRVHYGDSDPCYDLWCAITLAY